MAGARPPGPHLNPVNKPPETCPHFRLGLQLVSRSSPAGEARSVILGPPLGLPASSPFTSSRREASGMQGWASCSAQRLPEVPHCPLLQETLFSGAHSPSPSGSVGLCSLATHHCLSLGCSQRDPQPLLPPHLPAPCTVWPLPGRSLPTFLPANLPCFRPQLTITSPPGRLCPSSVLPAAKMLPHCGCV